MGPASEKPGSGPKLTVRVPRSTLTRLDALAAEEGTSRARLVRRLVDAALEGRPPAPSTRPDERELLDLLAEKARAGNVAAIRSLLAREQATDPHARALADLQEMARERRSSVVSDLLRSAFVALGTGPTWAELDLVAKTLRSSGDREALDLLEAAAGDRDGALDEVDRIAVDSGSGPLTALDLVVAVASGIEGLRR